MYRTFVLSRSSAEGKRVTGNIYVGGFEFSVVNDKSYHILYIQATPDDGIWKVWKH